MVESLISRRGLLFAPTSLSSVAAAELLFNGKDLAGWRHFGHGIWTVEEGALVGRFDHSKPGPGYLFTERVFGDFVLELEFWVSKGGNSGVYVRQPLREIGPFGDERPAHSAGDGVEIQIDYNDSKNLTGAVYNKKNSVVLAGGEDRWNRYAIECRGSRLRVRVDGELVNEYEPLTPAAGAIGLQIHGGRPHRHVVKFRNLRLTV
jgi:hypothetical protein